MPKRILIVMLVSFIFSAYGKVLRYDITHPRVLDFSFKEVCKELGNTYPIIIDVKGPVTLDCMGNTVNVNEFCQRKFEKKEDLLRGVVSKKNKLVYCQFGRGAILSLSCDKNHNSYCQKPKSGCNRLKSIYAFNLKLSHHSLIEEVIGPKKISCYYEAKLPEVETKKLEKDLSGR